MDFAGLGALFEGAASGIEAGTRLGLLVQQNKRENEKMDMTKKAATAAADKDAKEMELNKIGKITDMYKEAGPKTKSIIFKTWANQVNKAFGTTIDPESEQANGTYLEDFGKLVTMKQKGTIGDDDFLYAAGELRSKMDKESSTQAGAILGDLPPAINAKKEKAVTPEDAAKRITEVTKLYADMGKRSDMEALAIAQNPDNAKYFGSVTPKDKAAARARLLAEVDLMNTHLPAAQQVRPVTQAQYDLIKSKVEAQTKRKVADSELMKKLIITDAE